MPETESICPACDSPNLWEEDFAEDGYLYAIYKHCYECGFCWNSRLEDNQTEMWSEVQIYNSTADTEEDD